MEPMLQFFKFAHLPPHLQSISQPFHDLAVQMIDTLPRNAERTAGLRKLLEAKDCAVRSMKPTNPSKQVLSKVFEAIQLLMDAGSTRVEAEELVCWMAYGTHTAPVGACEERS